MEQKANTKSYTSAFIWVTMLFFMWGFMTVMNDVLIPHLKKVFDLNYVQSMLVQFSFFGAYFIGSVAYYILSSLHGDPILKIGYKNGILLGLLLSCVGAFLFFPAAEFEQYGFFLAALFILGLGFTLLQISANPYVAILGPERSASARLNLSQAFNSLGTTIGPLIGGWAIFQYTKEFGLTGSDAVKIPYLVFGIIFVLLLVVIALAKLPKMTNSESTEKKPRAFAFPQLRFGMFAIFFYVGAEVSIGSFLVNYLGHSSIAGLDEAAASSFLALYWGGQMIGRFLGAISLSNMKNKFLKNALMIVIPILAFIIIGLNYGFRETYPYLILLVVNYIAFKLGRSIANKTLYIFAIFNICLLIVSLIFGGFVSMWAVLGIGLFNSIMWSNIFTLSIAKLDHHTNQGSSLLVMMIVGGAVLPLFMGFVADQVGIITSMVVPIICYIYIAFFGIYGYKPKDASLIDKTE
ncbi:MAG: sugar MFS transporter [Hyphomicrobiales bacterium]